MVYLYKCHIHNEIDGLITDKDLYEANTFDSRSFFPNYRGLPECKYHQNQFICDVHAPVNKLSHIHHMPYYITDHPKTYCQIDVRGIMQILLSSMIFMATASAIWWIISKVVILWQRTRRESDTTQTKDSSDRRIYEKKSLQQYRHCSI